MKAFIVVVSVIGVLLLILLAMRIVGEKVRFYKQLELDYPKEKYNGRARKTVKKKLKKFNFSFYRMYPGVNGDFKVIFTSYPKTHSDRFEYKKQIQMYERKHNSKVLQLLRQITIQDLFLLLAD